MNFTIFGGQGYIGRHLQRHLCQAGYTVRVPHREERPLGERLGHVIYAIGLTGNFRSQHIATIDAHVNVLAQLLTQNDYDSWLYLSSTRVYGGLNQNQPADEDQRLSLLPSSDAIYDLSKLLGESLCLAQERANVRVARLSNVYGPGQSPHTFLGALITEIQQSGQAVIRESPLSCKDYIAIADVIALLPVIALHGQQRTYNVASGHLIYHSQLAERLTQITGCPIHFQPEAPTRQFPLISNARITSEFGFQPRLLLDDLPDLLVPLTT